MNITVIGTGYVGLVTGTCLSEYGNNVICADTDEEKIKLLNAGTIPIYEQGLQELVENNLYKKRLSFTADISTAVKSADICFICVGTPPGDDGSADLQHVMQVARDIGQAIEDYTIVVDKSTVPVGTADMVRKTVQAELDERKSGLDFDVVSNPEFLKEGVAIEDCMRPDRIVIGTDKKHTEEVMRRLYAPFVDNDEKIISMDIRSAEMTKYAANAMLATKISFMNELSNVCERIGADINKVRLGIGSDRRIGYLFINPGCGYGGSCFPKDIKALIKTAEGVGCSAQLLNAVMQVNERQKQIIPQKILKKFGSGGVRGSKLRNLTFAAWGLSFKPGTDDMREAAAIAIINELTQEGATVRAYDPKAMDEAKKIYLRGNGGVIYCDSKEEALEGADAMILITEWEEFKNPNFDIMREKLKAPVIFDGRNQYDSALLAAMGFEYYQIGVGLK